MAHILIVEDVPESAEMAAQILRHYGHDPFIAETGLRGLALAKEHLPDLIIYDFMLPDIDARAFLDRIRAEDDLAKTPIVACSASPCSLIEKSVGVSGFAGCIHKPYRLSTFMRVVEEHLPV
jgi:CheY-like chemotaxis protein